MHDYVFVTVHILEHFKTIPKFNVFENIVRVVFPAGHLTIGVTIFIVPKVFFLSIPEPKLSSADANTSQKFLSLHILHRWAWKIQLLHHRFRYDLPISP